MDDQDFGSFTLTGTISRSALEIRRVLERMQARSDAIVAQVNGAELEFRSIIRHVDPAEQYIIVARSPLESANAALLSRSQCTFRSAPAGRHIEFVAGGFAEVTHDGAAAIRLAFPAVLVMQRRAESERSAVRPHLPLRCVADAGGVASFDAHVTDLGAGGMGFLIYSPEISLEPGTVLKSCSIALPGGAQVSVDLEVRYTLPAAAEDGRRVLRSGCRLVNPPRAMTDFIQGLLADPAKRET